MSELHSEILDGFDVIMQRLQGAPFLLNSGYPVAQSVDAVMQGKADPNAMKASFTIVTRGSGVNRQGNKLRIAPTEDGNGQGLSLDNYKTNPVCFLDHGQRGLSLPIGKSEDPNGNNTVKLYQSKADADIYFSQRLPEAVQVFGLVDEGILRTASISFMPRRATLVKTKRQDGQKTQSGDDVIDMSPGRWGSFDFIDSDMLEWSIVGIPADAGAVRKFLDRGTIHGEKITQGMRYALNQMAEAPSPWVPVSQASDVSRLENIFETWMTKANEILDQFGRVVSQAKETTGESDADDAGGVESCATCGKPKNDHNVRHPFKSKKQSVVDAPAVEITTPAVEQGFDAAAFAASVTESMKQSIDASFAPIMQKQEALEKRLNKALGKVD